MLQIKKVENKKDLKDFIMLPFKIYKDDDNWVAPLIQDTYHRFDSAKNPYYEHAEVELFNCYNGGEIVGRIACHIDHNHNSFHKETTAFFGFFELINDYDIAKTMFDHAVEWAKKRNMNILRGPMSFGTNDECSFLLEGFDSPPVIMMTYNPPFYLEFCEKYGFYKAKDLLAFLKNASDPMDPRMEKQGLKVAEDPTIRVRKFDRKDVKNEVNRVKEVYDQAWEPNWGFIPMTSKEIDETVKILLNYADTDLVWFAEKIHPDGTIEPIGISVVLPNLNEALKPLKGKMGPIQILKFLSLKKKVKGTRGLLFGLKKQYQGFGVPVLLFLMTQKEGLKKGYQWIEMSWNLEDNVKINTFDKHIGGKVYKKYRIYDLNL